MLIIKSLLRTFFLEQAMDTLLSNMQWNLLLSPKIVIPHTEAELIEYFDSGRARAELGAVYDTPLVIRYAISHYGLQYVVEELEWKARQRTQANR